MGTVKYHAPSLYGDFLGKRSVESLNELDTYLNVSFDSDGLGATISSLEIPSCYGVFCKIDELGYKPHLD